MCGICKCVCAVANVRRRSGKADDDDGNDDVGCAASRTHLPSYTQTGQFCGTQMLKYMLLFEIIISSTDVKWPPADEWANVRLMGLCAAPIFVSSELIDGEYKNESPSLCLQF